MLDIDGELPYVVWYQCKSCTHLFYNEQSKILAHLRDKHGYGEPKPSASPKSFKHTPLKIKEHHFRPVVPSTSSGTDGDGEDNCAEDILNNNTPSVNYATNLSFIRRRPRFFLKNDNPTQIDINQQSRNSRSVGKVVPSIEELKRQLINSDIDISEIKMSGHEEEVDDDEPEEVEGDEGMEYNEETEEDIHSQGYGFHSESFDVQDNGENSEDPEEGASISNLSFYDNDIGEHFLFKNGPASESNYEDEGIMTPNFSMVDELYRRASLAASTTASEVTPTPGRKRTNLNPCKLCKRNFPSLSLLKKHAKSHLNEEGARQHMCKFCFEYFATAAQLSKHITVHEENPNECNICHKKFTSWATLRTHLKIHSGERNFCCDHPGCDARFQTKSTLDSHLRIHSGSRPHRCPICEKSFRTSSPLYRHLRSVHKGLSVPMNS